LSRLLLIFLSIFISAQTWAAEGDELDLESGETPVQAEVKPPPKAKTKVVKKRKKRVAVSESPWHPVVSLGYHMGGDATFKEVNYKSTLAGTFKTSATYDVGPAIELSGGILYMSPQSWGFLSNLVYQMNRDIKSVNVGGSKVTSKSSLQLLLIEAGGLYRWDEIYLPFGFNYSLAKYNAESSESGKTEVLGGVGVQSGVGYILNKHIQIELLWKMIGIQSKTVVGTDTIELGNGYLRAINLKVGYVW
jgi:hypothetical protein